jgi:hypothetical protein
MWVVAIGDNYCGLELAIRERKLATEANGFHSQRFVYSY